MEALTQIFGQFVAEFSLKRVTGILFIATVGILGFNYLERNSPYFALGRLERATTLLEKLAAVEVNPATAELIEVRDAVVRELRRQIEPAPLLGTITDSLTGAKVGWKFVAGFMPWGLLSLFFLVNRRRDPTSINGILGAIFFGAIWGGVGLSVLPDSWVTGKGLVGFGIGNFVLSLLIVLVWQARQARRRS